MEKHVLLIGATDFVGSAILNELVNRGHRVTAIVRDKKGLADRKDVESVVADATNPDTLARTQLSLLTILVGEIRDSMRRRWRTILRM